jgi:hypothetical protein
VTQAEATTLFERPRARPARRWSIRGWWGGLWGHDSKPETTCSRCGSGARREVLLSARGRVHRRWTWARRDTSGSLGLGVDIALRKTATWSN